MANQLPLPPNEPQTFADLFAFYHTYVKVLYSVIQTENVLPIEVLFELNAALDHMSRHWVYGQDEARVVALAYGHLKRSCFDIFKIKVKEARSQYEQLRKIDTSAIDNGDFDRKLNALFAEIRLGATEARHLEGDSRTDADGPIQAFEKWQPVFEACLRLDQEFFHHPALDWAKRRYWKRFWRTSIGAAALLFIASALGKEYSSEIIGVFKGLGRWIAAFF